jgi:ATP-dependent Clp protease protease subunit
MFALTNRIITRETGQPLDKVERDTDRNYWMSAEEAIAYGRSAGSSPI